MIEEMKSIREHFEPFIPDWAKYIVVDPDRSVWACDGTPFYNLMLNQWLFRGEQKYLHIGQLDNEWRGFGGPGAVMKLQPENSTNC